MGETDNPSFSRFRDVCMSPRTQKPVLFIFGDPRIPQIIQGTIQTILPNVIWGNLNIFEIDKFESSEKNIHQQIMKIRVKIA